MRSDAGTQKRNSERHGVSKKIKKKSTQGQCLVQPQPAPAGMDQAQKKWRSTRTDPGGKIGVPTALKKTMPEGKKNGRPRRLEVLTLPGWRSSFSGIFTKMSLTRYSPGVEIFRANGGIFWAPPENQKIYPDGEKTPPPPKPAWGG